MTRSRSSFIYILLVGILCFAAGVASVFLRDDFLQPRAIPTRLSAVEQPPPTAETTDSSRQLTIVLFGVDDLSLDTPQLQALWFASFEPPLKEIQMLGVPVNANIGEDKETLMQSFTLFEPPDFGARFLTSLATIAPHPIHGFLVLDEEGFVELIDYIGGVTLDNQQLNGTAAIGALTLLKDQPVASLRMQSRLVTSLTQKAASMGSTPELTPLTSLVPEHAYTSPSPYQLASLGSQLLPIDPSLVTIEIKLND